ncbi:MAG: N-glycosylase/DNA lyase [Methanospirillaceae archaeon]|nr:N-glycosylase/DNA lyase [Methanospirillaceae archaeon]
MSEKKPEALRIPRQVYSFFTSIPYPSWDLIVQNEPEWIEFKPFHERYSFGLFAVLMVMCGLNAYQLKGRAETGYFPAFRDILLNNRNPENPDELVSILYPLYECDRLPKGKCSRLHRFVQSDLGERIWYSSPSEIEESFIRIWHDLAAVMKQKEDKKTVVFAMKCLGIALLMEHKMNFSFEAIPIPVDSRIRKITAALGGPDEPDRAVQQFWHQVIEKIREKDSTITMIHLDSFLWQVTGYTGEERKEWFCRNGICFLQESFTEIVTEK